jgi:hypothetical protein
MLFGKDLSMLMKRLANPMEFWKTNQGKERIQVWPDWQ